MAGKVAVVGLASILLVAMVVAVAVSYNKKNDEGGGGESPDINSSTKSVHSICQPTDYKETCEKTLQGTNSSDPKELVQVAFNRTVEDLREAIKNSTLYKDAESDPRTKSALKVCEEVLNDSIDDLQRSFDRVQDFDMSKMNEYTEDLKTWLSGAIDHHEACNDAFENTTGDTGEKMKEMLNSTGKMLSNGLAMVDSISSIFMSLGMESFTSNRRLMTSLSLEDPWSPPRFVDAAKRKLMAAPQAPVKTDIVVAQDGSGDFNTVGAAIGSLPRKNNLTITIHVKAGIYKETVTIPKKINNIILIGDGPKQTRITDSKNYADGTPTYHTAVLAVNADGFMAKDIGIENTAGAVKHQAVAVRVSGDKAVFFNVHMDGFQDTLYTHSYRQYYRDCVITGTIDFVFGDAASVFQKCRLVVRKPMDTQACMVTAQGRKDRRSIGAIVIQDCDIAAEAAFTQVQPPLKAYLGRPWKEYSRTIIMQSMIEGFIQPEGWAPWMGNFALDTLYYGEFENRGPGSDQSKRVTWKGIQKMTPQLAESFTPGKLYAGDEWVTKAAVPYVAGMMQV